MPTPHRLIRTAGGITVVMSDGTKLGCVPDSVGNYVIRNGQVDPPDPDPDPGTGGWQHPLGPNWPTGTWTTYSGEPSHDAGAVDFGAGYGGEPPLYAACDGEVIFAGRWGVTNPNYPQSGQSLTLVVQPDGESVGITYLHMNRIDVEVGDRVVGGQQVGIVGWTGWTEPPGPGGAHLHLEVRSNGVDWGPWEPAVAYFASKGVTL